MVTGPLRAPTAIVVPVCKSRRQTCWVAPTVGTVVRSEAWLLNATKRPSALTRHVSEKLLAKFPAGLAETREVVPAFRSRAQTCVLPLVTRLEFMFAELLRK